MRHVDNDTVDHIVPAQIYLYEPVLHSHVEINARRRVIVDSSDGVHAMQEPGRSNGFLVRQIGHCQRRRRTKPPQ